MSENMHKKFKPTERFWRLTAFISMGVAVLFAVLWVAFPLDKMGTDQGSEETVEDGQGAENAVTFETTGDMDVSEVDLTGMKIIVDAGHGGDDVGMIGSFTGRYEKEVNLEIAQKLQRILTEEGATVIMTRQTDELLGGTKDEDWVAREKIISDANADMFVSIHQNQFEKEEASGPQVFFVQQGAVGKRLAVCIQDMMNLQLDPAEPRMALDAAYRILKTGSQPSCTVECGFMSNEKEEEQLQTDEYQERVARAIADGMKLYVKQYE